MENMKIYNAVADVPETAKKSIKGGRLSGMTDINPMWRIMTLTEQFGPCGIGWYYEITKQWTEQGANGEIIALTNINLYINVGGEWSKPISGTGGSALIAKERNGLYTSDECFKMSLTDAISVACKALGVGANVYWQQGRSKYSEKPPAMPPEPEKTPEPITKEQTATIQLISKEVAARFGADPNDIFRDVQEMVGKGLKRMTSQDGVKCIEWLTKQLNAEEYPAA